ncbi:uncharacterized protein METZ01_LOCUS292702 [marine metagenome]|uniref:Uncharacterized protein n=1 Tax=marine metagenome TaxID=408172 RepID=A0A382LT57_9ZZZZ
MSDDLSIRFNTGKFKSDVQCRCAINGSDGKLCTRVLCY